LKQQQGDFEKKRARNEDTNKTSLQNQREKYAKALYQQQRENDGKYNKVAAREDDPFYSLQSFEAKLEEHDDHYVVRAQVPPHERDRVDIRVKDGKVALSASRQMEEKRDNEGVKVSSSAFQTWRQDIPLKMPIYREAVTKTIEPEDSMVEKKTNRRY
jgi:HSP20 family molecular chaperone IbpA